MKIQEHIRFFNKVLALLQIYSKQKADNIAYIELHSLDVYEDNGNKYLNVTYSYTRLDRNIIRDFDLIPFEYLYLDLKEAEKRIKEDY